VFGCASDPYGLQTALLPYGFFYHKTVKGVFARNPEFGEDQRWGALTTRGESSVGNISSRRFPQSIITTLRNLRWSRVYFRDLARGAYNEYGAWRAMCVCLCLRGFVRAVGAPPGLRSLAAPLSGARARSNLCMFAIYIVCVRERESSATPTNRTRPKAGASKATHLAQVHPGTPTIRLRRALHLEGP
jgi:hypothetical protein